MDNLAGSLTFLAFWGLVNLLKCCLVLLGVSSLMECLAVDYHFQLLFRGLSVMGALSVSLGS